MGITNMAATIPGFVVPCLVGEKRQEQKEDGRYLGVEETGDNCPVETHCD